MNGPGRPSLYKPEFAEQAFELCLAGATNQDLADTFEVGHSTIDNLDKQANYGPLNQDRRHNFSANFVYEVPDVSGRFGGKGIAKQVFTGWQLSPVLASAAMSLSSVSVLLNSLRLRTAVSTDPPQAGRRHDERSAPSPAREAPR